MKKLILYFFLILLASCTSNTIFKKPKNLIKKDKMVHIITDMLLAGSAENVKNLSLERKINYYPLVYQKYTIDSLQFKQSIHYYISTIDDYTEILKKVETKLKERKKELQAKESKKDSLLRLEMVKDKKIEKLE